MQIYSVEEMRLIEKNAFGVQKISESIIIENVAINATAYFEKKFATKVESGGHGHFFYFLIGKGNNGADGVAIARHLANKNHNVVVNLLFKNQKLSQELMRQIEVAKNFGVKFSDESIESDIGYLEDKCDLIIVDAVFGIGLNDELPKSVGEHFKFINKLDKNVTKIAIDIPSGVHGDYGLFDENAFCADITLAIHSYKNGHFSVSSLDRIGDLVVIDAGFDKRFTFPNNNRLFLYNEANNNPFSFSNDLMEGFSNLFNVDNFAYKNTLGHLLIIGGSKGLSGAPVLSSLAASKVGVGLVTIATWEESFLELNSKMPPSIMSQSIETLLEKSKADLKEYLNQKFSAIVIGPGLSVSENSLKILKLILDVYQNQIVLDADAINVLAHFKKQSLLSSSEAKIILTPHLGELKRLAENDFCSKNSISCVEEFAAKFNVTVVFKCGPLTITSHKDRSTFVNFLPNPSLARAGSGDILAGIIGGMIARLGEEHIVDSANFSVMMLSALGFMASSNNRSPLSNNALDLLSAIDNFFNLN